MVSATTAITACPTPQWQRSLILASLAHRDSWAAAVTTLGRAVQWREAMQLGGLEATHDALMLAYASAVEKRSKKSPQPCLFESGIGISYLFSMKCANG